MKFDIKNLKRDPSNNCLIGPDDCHYENEHQVYHYALLHLCGCGCPEEAYNFCRDALKSFDRRDKDKDWINAEDAVKALIIQKPDEAAHVISHLLSHLNLLEHGGSVGGSWLTELGEVIVDHSEMTEALMEEGR